jgi:uncharacterized protein YdeI (YjbR/CyaY-like superfamily)
MTTPPENSVHPATRAGWRAWLEAHHERGEGVWLIRFRKGAGQPPLAYNDAVEEAICFGWIDSLPRRLDAQRTMLWFAPRKRGSRWSKANRERAERMMAAGLITPAGEKAVDAAKRDGSWSALEPVEALEVPPDLAGAFDRHPGAGANFAAFPPSVRRGILEWILSAKRDETRERRVEETARLAQENVRAHQWRGEGTGPKKKG